MWNEADDLDKANELAEQERIRALKALADNRDIEAKIILERQQSQQTEIACADCGEIIPEQRLQAQPSALLCIDCKRTQDKINRLYV